MIGLTRGHSVGLDFDVDFALFFSTTEVLIYSLHQKLELTSAKTNCSK